ncbi:putative Ig domain-containing protein, partial [Gemmatimonadota bacterium]
WAVTVGSLPAGLSLSSSTGVISGTPTTAGTFNFTVQATSAGLSDTAALSITVAWLPVSVTTTSLPGGQTGVAYSQTLAATGGDGTYTWAVTVGSLPAGLSLSSSTGVISGTPTTDGTSNFTVQATSAGLSGTADLSITVGVGLAITTTSLPGGYVGIAYSSTLAATGGTTPYSWAVTVGSLPAGLSLSSSTGVISGTPTTVENPTFTVQVQSADLQTATAALSVDVTAFTFDCATQTEIPLAECQALVTLYGATNGPSWTSSTGWLATPTPCSWYGVTCTGGSVTNLDLYENGLVGTIPAALGNLSNLQGLHLPKNQLSGSIPSELGNLSNLQVMRLFNNQLTGSIPASIGTLSNVTWLRLYNNQLSGSIPDLSGMTSLLDLYLSNNNLTGGIPASLGSLPNLQDINISFNPLGGSIPAALGNISTLVYFEAFDAGLTGAIPAELGTLSNLATLRLYNNSLSGSIPAALGSMSSLEVLQLYNNGLTGTIPATLGNLSNLRTLWISYNGLTGSIPTELSTLSNLTNLYLQGNDLSGLVPLPVAQTGGQMQATLGATSCDVASAGNSGLSMTDNQDYRDADQDGDGFICYLGGLTADLAITTASLPNGTVDTAYSQTLAATGGSGGYTWSLASGTLPAGLTLNASTGEISGSPTTVETQSFTVQVDSGDGQTATAGLSIQVVAAPPQALDPDGDRN